MPALALRLDDGAPVDWQLRCLRELRRLTGACARVILDGPPPPGWPADLPAPVRAEGAQGTDLALDLSHRPTPARWAAQARLGCWWFRWGEDGDANAAGLGELLSGRRAIGAALLSRDPDGAERVLRAGHVRTVRHSPAATRARLFATAADWPARVLADPPEAPDPAPPPPAPSWPAPLRRALLPAALARNLAVRLLDEAWEEHWTLGLLPVPVAQAALEAGPEAIRWLPGTRGGFLADPFAAEVDGRAAILAEAFDFDERLGVIVALDPDGDPASAREALRLPVHCSYPFLVQEGGETWMIPETGAAGRVELHRAVAFPDRWELAAVLLEDFAGCDATVFRHEGRWWMLAGDARDQGDAKLFAFHAPALRGPWRAHRLNPVKADLGSTRPAGAPFLAGGALHRPAQSSLDGYGGAVAINRILRLTPDAFEERTVRMLRPDPDGPCPDGLHTLNAFGDRTIVDGKRMRLSARRLAWGLARALRDRRAARSGPGGAG